jgi:SAM-dependent methyltransferase
MTNTDLNAQVRFAALSASFDETTERHLLNHGLAPGWRCLEVGAGGGSIARWLSDRVGPTGRVIATDLDTRFIGGSGSSNLEVLCHDITRDPIPGAPFDLVHARMILIHLPERDAVLQRLAAVVKPGGWLVCEEFDAISVDADPSVSPGEIRLKAHDAMRRLSADRQVNGRYGRLLFGRFRDLGLTDIGAEGRISMLQAGSPGAALLRASYELRRSAMTAAGYITDDDFDANLAQMETAEFMMPSPILWTVWGRRSQERTCVAF